MDEKVTVVVPVFNVSKYLDKCVQSLLHQTIFNYKIILVDDGSTDDSGIKCDNWAATNKNIITLHKKNGGLSDARNFGAKYVDTEYVTFVDSDDYVEPQYIEILIKGLSFGADMVVTHHIQENDNDPRSAAIIEHYDIFSTEQALKLLCYEQLSTCAWGKLFPVKYVLEDPFPSGKLYEDLLTMYKYIGRSKIIAFNRSQTYHYVQRKGSIRQGKWNKRYFDVMEGANNLLDFIDNNYPQLHEAGVFRYFYSANELYVRSFNSEEYMNIIKPTRKMLKLNIKDILDNHEVHNKFKVQYFLMTEFPKLYRLIWKYYKR